MAPHHTNAIPQILEDMRDHLCVHDLQSREIRDYFVRYLHDKTDHFIHEFYNFAISPFDIVGYDRNVDYNPRDTPPNAVATVEISSNESSDGEVQVVSTGDEAGTSSSTVPENITEIVLETTGAQEERCRIGDINVGEIEENVPAASSEVVVDSSDSDCEFVLALKPPHLRTPEQVSLDSASDSDVIFIPATHQSNTICSSESDDPEDNKPLSETRKQLKSEIDDGLFDANMDIKTDDHIPDPSNKFDMKFLNYGASTSTASQPDESVVTNKKFYYHPIRKRTAGKSIFEGSSSSSPSSESETSDVEWHSKISSRLEQKHSKASKNRRKTTKKHKKRRISSTIVSNQKPLSELPTSEEAREDNHEAMSSLEYPRVKSVIIKKFDNDQHYIQNNSNSDVSGD